VRSASRRYHVVVSLLALRAAALTPARLRRASRPWQKADDVALTATSCYHGEDVGNAQTVDMALLREEQCYAARYVKHGRRQRAKCQALLKE